MTQDLRVALLRDEGYTAQYEREIANPATMSEQAQTAWTVLDEVYQVTGLATSFAVLDKNMCKPEWGSLSKPGAGEILGIIGMCVSGIACCMELKNSNHPRVNPLILRDPELLRAMRLSRAQANNPNGLPSPETRQYLRERSIKKFGAAGLDFATSVAGPWGAALKVAKEGNGGWSSWLHVRSINRIRELTEGTLCAPHVRAWLSTLKELKETKMAVRAVESTAAIPIPLAGAIVSAANKLIKTARTCYFSSDTMKISMIVHYLALREQYIYHNKHGISSDLLPCGAKPNFGRSITLGKPASEIFRSIMYRDSVLGGFGLNNFVSDMLQHNWSSILMEPGGYAGMFDKAMLD